LLISNRCTTSYGARRDFSEEQDMMKMEIDANVRTTESSGNMERGVSRRQALAWLGGSFVVAACGDKDDEGGEPEQETGNSLVGGFARGGTRSLAASYPDPFASSLGTVCDLTCLSTIGPCYATTQARKDISEGYPGLPVRLSLLVLDPDCKPIADAEVDIWHTRNSGSYSGDDTGLGFMLPALPPNVAPPAPVGAGGAGAAPAFTFDCSAGDAEARQASFFRGTQRTNAAGRVDFDTCYPGAYTGRALHVHFTVRRNGQEWVTSQLYYPEDLTQLIYREHPDYAPFGTPDTVNSTDGIFQGPAEVLDIVRQPDGALVASKALVLRASLSDELCGSAGLGLPPAAADTTG
jgi:protocatechuate 3,4-dioxygenase beta subunit